MGTNKLSSGGTRYKVKEIIPHEQYNQQELANDIALIRVQMPIEFGANAQAINYSTKEIGPNENLQISGWSLTKVYNNFLSKHRNFTNKIEIFKFLAER